MPTLVAPAEGISLNTDQTATTGVQVACVNPAAIGGGMADLETYWPANAAASPLDGTTIAVGEYALAVLPQAIHRTCETKDGASWLQVTPVAAPWRHSPAR